MFWIFTSRVANSPFPRSRVQNIFFVMLFNVIYVRFSYWICMQFTCRYGVLAVPSQFNWFWHYAGRMIVCMHVNSKACCYVLCMCRAKKPTKKWIGHLISINKIKKEVLMEYLYLQCTHDDMWHFDWRWWWGVERIYMITGGGAIKKFFGSCTDL